MTKEQVIYENIIAQTCPRRRCFAPITTRVHEYRASGREAMGLGNVQIDPGAPVVKRNVFKRCATRDHSGCPARFIKHY